MCLAKKVVSKSNIITFNFDDTFTIQLNYSTYSFQYS